MELLLDRAPADGARVFGELQLVGVWKCFTLENGEKLIPTGTYKVDLTVSGRAKAGTLWTPWSDNLLPLVFVPNREGIRIHAANFAYQLEGCIALGVDRTQEQLLHSQDAVRALKKYARFPFFLTIKET